MVKKWPGFDMYHMGIVVETVLRDALPKSVHPKRDVIISKRALSKVSLLFYLMSILHRPRVKEI